jgi:hypothetical protein
VSGSGSGGTWVEPVQDSCEKLTSETTLTSPVRDVVSQLAVGDVLDVRVDNVGGTPVVRVVHDGNVAGSITSAVIQRIVECIEKGHAYVAEVLSVQGGACRVRVRIR